MDTNISSEAQTPDIPDDIDLLFGDPADDAAGSPTGNTSPGHHSKNVQIDNTNLDEGFGEKKHTSNEPVQQFTKPKPDVDWKAEATKFQSMYDKQVQASKEMESYKTAYDFINELYESPETRKAFIAELEPDLLKPEDPYTYVQNSLVKEFGEGFTPDNNAEPGSQEWLRARAYDARMNHLLNEAYSKGNETPETLKELRARQKKDSEKQQQAFAREKADLMKEFNWNDGDWENFEKFANKITTKHLGKLFSKAQKSTTKGSSVPNLVNVPGSSTSSNDNYFDELKGFFG